jgi:type VI secretion system protein ImpM
MNASAATGVAGWFGKLPSLGDFASRRLPDAFVHGWDDWLQRGLASARDELGEGWLDRHGLCTRRFWLGPAVLGRVSWAGLLIPSSDRVGRRFPLTIAASLAPHSHSLAIALAAHPWFDAVDRVARQVQLERLSVDELERELAQVAAQVPMIKGADVAADRLAVALLRPYEDAPDAMGRIDPRPCSVWWCDDAREESEFLCADRLPPAAAFASLLGERTPPPALPVGRT